MRCRQDDRGRGGDDRGSRRIEDFGPGSVRLPHLSMSATSRFATPSIRTVRVCCNSTLKGSMPCRTVVAFSYASCLPPLFQDSRYPSIPAAPYQVATWRDPNFPNSRGPRQVLVYPRTYSYSYGTCTATVLVQSVVPESQNPGNRRTFLRPWTPSRLEPCTSRSRTGATLQLHS